MRDQWGVVNYLPERKSGVDDDMVKALVMQLKTEQRKQPSQREKESIRHCMEMTFPERRAMVVKERKSIADVKKDYPILFEESEVSILLHRFICGIPSFVC